jgi:hypothetical protein
VFIKGTAVIARQEQIRRRFGEDRWRAFMRGMAERFPEFGDNIFVTSRISVESFLAFQEEIVAAFYGGEDDPYFRIGAEAAQWVFTEGPYSRLVERRDLGLDALLAEIPAEIWSKYYDFGAMSVTPGERSARVLITGIPVEHPYFHRTAAGFMQRTFELFGATGVAVGESPGAEPGSRLFLVTFESWAPRA